MTGVLEDNTATFAGNWAGTGAIENAGDNERLALESGEYMEGEIVDTGTTTVEIDYNHYQAGDVVTVKYRHGATPGDCAAAAWNVYAAPFVSLGYVQVRVEATI